MKQGLILVLALTFSGCTTIQSLSKGSTLILKARILAGTHTQTVVNPYDQSAINHLKLELYPLVGGVPQAKIAGQTLSNAQLDNPIVFSNLKSNTSYRIQASAYYSADDSQLISSPASSSTDIVLTTDDRPTVSTLQVALIDRAFDGGATSSLQINNGHYTPIATEGLSVPKIVTTLAGRVQGYQDGVGTAALFRYPRGIAVNPYGLLYVSDINNHMIRCLNQAGVVTSIAGNLTTGYQDGTGSAAMFNIPEDIVLDSNGNLYVADYWNNRVRKIDKNFVVTTFSGTGGSGWADGAATVAQFLHPYGLAVDSSNNVYVADIGNHRIRKIDTNGNASTLAGSGAEGSQNGNGTNAQFNSPTDVAVDSAGNVFVADVANHRIRKIAPGGLVTTFAGSSAGFKDGLGTSAMFYSPYGLAIDSSGNLFVADMSNNSIRKIDPTGLVTTVAGSNSVGTQDGAASNASFSAPQYLAVDAYGNVFVSDSANHRIRKIQ